MKISKTCPIYLELVNEFTWSPFFLFFIRHPQGHILSPFNCLILYTTTTSLNRGERDGDPLFCSCETGLKYIYIYKKGKE